MDFPTAHPLLASPDVQRMTVSLCSTFPRNRRTCRRMLSKFSAEGRYARLRKVARRAGNSRPFSPKKFRLLTLGHVSRRLAHWRKRWRSNNIPQLSWAAKIARRKIKKQIVQLKSPGYREIISIKVCRNYRYYFNDRPFESLEIDSSDGRADNLATFLFQPYV